MKELFDTLIRNPEFWAIVIGGVIFLILESLLDTVSDVLKNWLRRRTWKHEQREASEERNPENPSRKV